MLYNIELVFAMYQHESAIGIHTAPPSGTSLPPPTPSHPSGVSQSTDLSSLLHTANSHWLCILHMVMYLFATLHLSHPLLPLLRPVSLCSLCLCRHCCPPNRFISTIVLDSTYMHEYMIFIFFTFWLTSLCIIGCRFIHLIRTGSHVFLFMAA